LINQRDTISYQIKQRLAAKAKEFFIDIDDCALVKIIFNWTLSLNKSIINNDNNSNYIFRLILLSRKNFQMLLKRSKLLSKMRKE